MSDVGHRVQVEWMGETVESLEDLLRPGLRIVCVGMNPAPVSVAAGHYYQGRLGQGFWTRLRAVGLMPSTGGWEDDTALALGIGFTDVVKRPTPGESGVTAQEFEYGRDLLLGKLEKYEPGIVLFVFKKAATTLLGSFTGNGFIGRSLGGADVFVMPGPYESSVTATRTLAALRERA